MKAPTDTSSHQAGLPVPPAFSDVFSHFYFAENISGTPLKNTLVPTFETMLVFVYGPGVFIYGAEQEKIFIEKCILLGPVKKALTYLLPAHSSILVISFKEDAFFRFFGRAPLSGGTIHRDPDTLTDDHCFGALWERTAVTKKAEDKIKAVVSFCKPYLQKRSTAAKNLLEVQQSLLSPIKTIAVTTHQSVRNIQLHHKKYLGYSAREMARYQRFLKVLHILRVNFRNAVQTDWFDIIDQCGYYDQSQLIHDFQHYLDISPTKYLKLQRNFCAPAL